jgi:hypothetical protein
MNADWRPGTLILRVPLFVCKFSEYMVCCFFFFLSLGIQFQLLQIRRIHLHYLETDYQQGKHVMGLANCSFKLISGIEIQFSYGAEHTYLSGARRGSILPQTVATFY